MTKRRAAMPAAIAALVLLSLYLRSQQLHAWFWIDEGISVGVAHHHWWSIPHVLHQDGSPPAYYMLLGLWIRVFGDGEAVRCQRDRARIALDEAHLLEARDLLGHTRARDAETPRDARLDDAVALFLQLVDRLEVVLDTVGFRVAQQASSTPKYIGVLRRALCVLRNARRSPCVPRTPGPLYSP